ncbi:hypothetical protein [Microcystis aeruginosa]
MTQSREEPEFEKIEEILEDYGLAKLI